MSAMTIADRRAIMSASTAEADFRDLLQRDPRAAVQRATGRPVPSDANVSIITEGLDAWEFVVPAASIEAELPAPTGPRDDLENQVYALLRDDPAVRARVVGDPKGFLAEKFQLDLMVNVREERAGELLIVLPYRDSREELPDSALDLVVGGSTCPETAKA